MLVTLGPGKPTMRALKKLLALFMLAIFFLGDSAAEDQPPRSARPGLEAYLKKLGYDYIPLQRENDSLGMFAPVELAGTSALFLVDSGWSVTSIEKKLRGSLPEIPSADVLRLFGAQPDSPVTLVFLDNLKVGSVSCLNQPAQVREIRIRGKANVARGVLGADFFLRNHCLIDCVDYHLYIRSAKPPPEIQRALEQTMENSGFTVVNLHRSKSLVESCDAEVNGKAVTLLIDTGSFWSVLNEADTKQLYLNPHVTRVLVAGVGKSARTNSKRPNSRLSSWAELT